jgi:peptidyl-prolyl cis-trans isomerase C
MLKRAAMILVTGLMISTALAGSRVVAQEETVVATVNGVAIKTGDVEMAAEDLLAQLQSVPPEQRFQFLIEYLVERQLLAQAADKAKIASTEEYKRRLEYYSTKALRDSYFKTKIEPTISDEEAKKRYEEEIAKITPEEEVRARHILVKTEKEAKDVAAELKNGGNFEEIAKAKSIGPSAPRGGDLGYFTKDKMVPEFSEVAFKLKKDQISAPVKTNFGWHIIKVEDRRMQQLQEFDAIKSRIRNVLLRQKVTEIAETLRKNAKIEYLDADAKPAEQKPQ